MIQNGSTVQVHYTGKLTDGTTFDSSIGRAPFQFSIGTNEVIPGFENGLIGKFELNHENIQVDLLYYNCLDIDLPGINTICLTGISYQGEALKAKKQDTVVRGIQVILL